MTRLVLGLDVLRRVQLRFSLRCSELDDLQCVFECDGFQSSSCVFKASCVVSRICVEFNRLEAREQAQRKGDPAFNAHTINSGDRDRRN
jgi:hypothetical protein